VIFTASTPVVTAISHTEDRPIADRVADMHAIMPTAAGETVATSHDEFLASEIEPLEWQPDTALETFERAHEYQQEPAEAVGEAPACEGLPLTYERAAIAVLLLLLLIVGALWPGVIRAWRRIPVSSVEWAAYKIWTVQQH